MILIMKKITTYGLILAVTLLTGCIKETYDIDRLSSKVHLSPAFGVKVAYGKVTLSDFIQPVDTITMEGDTIYVYAEENNVIRFVFNKDSVISFSLEDYYDLDEIVSYSDTLQVGELSLGSFADTIGFSLDEISQKFPPAVRAALLLLDGSTGNFPAFPAVNLDEKVFGPFENFEYATFSEGFIEITVTNNLTIPINDLSIQLYNTAGPTPFGDPFTFPLINPGETISDVLDLENLILSNEVSAEVTLGANDGEDNVLIDLDASSIDIAVAGRDIKIKSGRVVLPLQEVSLDQNDTVSFDAGEDIEIEEIKILTGNLGFEINSAAPVNASVTVTLPSSSRDGIPVSETLSVEPGAFLDDSISLDNTTIDFNTIPTQPYNMLPVNYSLEVSSAGQMVDFNSTDEVTMEIELDDPEIDYIKGYFGQYGDTISSDTLDLEIEDILGNITGTVTLYPSISLNYQNSFAIPVEIDIDAVGYRGDNDSVDIDIDAQTLDYPDAPLERDVSGSYTINKDNSQLSELISFLPEKIRFGGSAVMNPQGNTGSRDNYIFGNSRFLGNIEVEVPMDLRISNLQFKDTIDNFMQDIVDEEDSPVMPEDIEYLHITFHAQNGFPLGLSLSMQLYDSTSATILSTIDATDFLVAADVDANGRVTEAADSPTLIEITNEFWDSATEADKIIFSIKLLTKDYENTDVKIYSDYYIDYFLTVAVKANVETYLDLE